MDRRATPPKRVTSPIWGTPPPCKQALRETRECPHGTFDICYDSLSWDVFKVDRLQVILVAKKYIYVSQLFISRMPKMHAIPQLVSAPLNPIPIAENFRRSHPPCRHENSQSSGPSCSKLR